MLKSKNKVVIITQGDPEGIGPEVIIKALNDKALNQRARYIVVGNQELFGKHLSKKNNVSIVDVGAAKGGQGAWQALDAGIGLIKNGVGDSLATAPLSKERVEQYVQGFKGHTEYLAKAFGVEHVDMMFACPQVKLVIATRHEPIKKLPQLITREQIVKCLELLNISLKKQFGMKKPTIAVLGLNPHAGESGLLGKEEITAIIPAINQVKRKRVNVSGPFAADTFFIEAYKQYDAILAMYHDQGLIPMKSLFFNEVVNTTIGLPFIRTSPVHGTGFDIAGQNKANHQPMLAAINFAAYDGS